MRYGKRGRKSYGVHKRRTDLPKKLIKTASIKPVGDWSSDLLKSTDAGVILASKHLINVVKAIEKEKPKTKTELEKVLKKAVMTPQQRFVILYEKSLRVPLSTQEFHEYMELFRENFPKAYESLYGKKTPAKIVAECIRNQNRKRK